MRKTDPLLFCLLCQSAWNVPSEPHNAVKVYLMQLWYGLNLYFVIGIRHSTERHRTYTRAACKRSRIWRTRLVYVSAAFSISVWPWWSTPAANSWQNLGLCQMPQNFLRGAENVGRGGIQIFRADKRGVIWIDHGARSLWLLKHITNILYSKAGGIGCLGIMYTFSSK